MDDTWILQYDGEEIPFSSINLAPDGTFAFDVYLPAGGSFDIILVVVDPSNGYDFTWVTLSDL